MFFFFIGGLEQQATKVLQPNFTRCIRCGSSSADLVETEKVLNMFFVPVWRWPGKEPAVYCRNCSFLYPQSAASSSPPSTLPAVIRCGSCDRVVDSPEFRFCPFFVVILLNQWMGKGLINILEHAQLFGGTWLGAYSALCFSCGYFAYDQWDMLRYRLYSGWIPAILVHHLILLVCFTLALYRNVTINYLILTLVCEVHSIFLHIRKVRRMAGMRDAKNGAVKVEWILNWVTFFVARLGCHVLITYKLVVDAPKFGKGIELPLALFGMIGMNLLNIFLGLDLFKAYRRENTRQKSRD